MEVDPAEFPVTNPEPLTEATAEFPLDQVPLRVSVVPVFIVTVGVMACVAPGINARIPGARSNPVIPLHTAQVSPHVALRTLNTEALTATDILASSPSAF